MRMTPAVLAFVLTFGLIDSRSERPPCERRYPRSLPARRYGSSFALGNGSKAA